MMRAVSTVFEEDLGKHGKDDNSNRDQDSMVKLGCFSPFSTTSYVRNRRNISI
jgi:hypothetical protein